MDVKRVDVVKTLEMRDGCVYKTQMIKTIWIPLHVEDEAAIAKSHGGDTLAATGEFLFGTKECDPMGQSTRPQDL